MKDTDVVNNPQPSVSGNHSDIIENVETRTRKFVVGLIAVITPIELVFAVTQYQNEPVTQLITFILIPILVLSYIVNAQLLKGKLRSGDHILRLLTHPLTLGAYGVLGVAGLIAAVRIATSWGF